MEIVASNLPINRNLFTLLPSEQLPASFPSDRENPRFISICIYLLFLSCAASLEMRAREMHPLCCIALESAAVTEQRSPAHLPPRSEDNAGKERGAEANVAGVLHKWTNYGKGWRSRWFSLRNGLLAYSKIRGSEIAPVSDEVRVIGDSSVRLARCGSGAGGGKIEQKTVGLVHLKVGYLRNTLVDDRAGKGLVTVGFLPTASSLALFCSKTVRSCDECFGGYDTFFGVLTLFSVLSGLSSLAFPDSWKMSNFLAFRYCLLAVSLEVGHISRLVSATVGYLLDKSAGHIGAHNLCPLVGFLLVSIFKFSPRCFGLSYPMRCGIGVSPEGSGRRDKLYSVHGMKGSCSLILISIFGTSVFFLVVVSAESLSCGIAVLPVVGLLEVLSVVFFGVSLFGVSSFRESKSDDRRFYIFTATKTLHLRTDSRKDRVAWIDALVSARSIFASRQSMNDRISFHSDVFLSTEKLRARLLKDGLDEALIEDCERIMRSEFSEMQGQLKLLCEERSNLINTLRQLEASTVDGEASGINETHFSVIKDRIPSPGHGKYSECSTTESSDDIEKQEPEEVSDEDESSYFDTRECFGDSMVTCGSIVKVPESAEENLNIEDSFTSVERMHFGAEVSDYKYPCIERRKKLPDPVGKEKGVSLWSMIKDNVGKDLTRICLPVYFNEPISSLQKCFEDMEYSYLLDRAYEYGKMDSRHFEVLNKTVRVGWAIVGGAEAWANYQSISTQSGQYFGHILGCPECTPTVVDFSAVRRFRSPQAPSAISDLPLPSPGLVSPAPSPFSDLPLLVSSFQSPLAILLLSISPCPASDSTLNASSRRFCSQVDLPLPIRQ
ncbi:hypothetical protein ACLOJK_033396 [Asimina triloba]